MARKPVLDQVPPKAASPILTRPPGRRRWTFSFRFWKQIEFFGLDKSDPKWFVSLLTKLVELSKEDIDAFRADGRKKEAWRYHDISWTQQNIPIQRSDLTWLHPDYRENEADYPLVQFQVSQALGRVVGFWDEEQVFNIVLLDPLHNIQPSKLFHYKVNPASPLPCKYSSLLHDIETVKKGECPTPDCPVHQGLRTVPKQDHFYDVMILRLGESETSDVFDLIKSGQASSVHDILYEGMVAVLGRGQDQAKPVAPDAEPSPPESPPPSLPPV